MSKRASGKFEKRPRDYYGTPREPCDKLFRALRLTRHTLFVEPCAGSGELVRNLSDASGGQLSCTFSCDIEPQAHGITQLNAFDLTRKDVGLVDYIITNPPWTRSILHPMIEHFADKLDKPTWLLFDADWMHTRQAVPFIPMLRTIVSVGRVSWMGNGVSGFDNCCWYLFHRPIRGNRIEFIPNQ